jgi:hypothetical protein
LEKVGFDLMAMQVVKNQQPYYAAKAKPRRNGSYLKWLHTLPCVVTGRYDVEAAHISYPSPAHGHWGRGKGTKAPDLFALPMSAQEHALQHSGKLGSESDYWEAKGICPHQLCIVLWAIYSAYDEDEATVRATARINQGLAAAGRLRERELS